MKTWTVINAAEFDEWLDDLSEKDNGQVISRIAKIIHQGHFGIHKSVSDNGSVWELKWGNGRRVYYAYIHDSGILLLLGGNKNGQDKDIAKAKKIFDRYKKVD